MGFGLTPGPGGYTYRYATVSFRDGSRPVEGGAMRDVYPRRWQALAVLALSLVVIGMDNTILNVALPTLVRDLGATSSQLQWIVDAYILVFAGLLLTAGSLGDRFGRQKALIAGLGIFGVGSLATLFVDSANGLIAVRALMG